MATQKIRKAVIPAAGLGTRFLPATKAVPKELLPIVDTPTIQYIVEEAVAAGVRDVILICARGKDSIVDHFDIAGELESHLDRTGKHELKKQMRAIAQMANVITVRQQEPLGLGHAVLCARDVVGDEPFVVMLGDDIIDSAVPGTKQLADCWDRHGLGTIALMEVPREETHLYGIAAGAAVDDRTVRIDRLVEKPKKDPPSNLAVIGRYVLPPRIFEVLEQVRPGVGGRDPAHRRARRPRPRGGAPRLPLRGRPVRRRRSARVPEGERRLRAEAARARAAAPRLAPGDVAVSTTLRRAAAALALAAALPAAAYVLPVPGILKRMGERRAALSLDALEVRGSLAGRGPAADRLAAAAALRPGAPEISVPARFLVKVPGRCRLEVVRADGPESERAFVAVRDGKLSGPLADLAPAAAFVRAACTLLAAPTAGDATDVFTAALGRRGVALGDVSLGRFDGRIAYVIGGRERQPKPLLYVDKDGFQPLRLVAAEGPDLVDVRLLGWGSPTGGDWFPRAVEVWAKDALALRFSTERAISNPRLAEPLFPGGK